MAGVAQSHGLPLAFAGLIAFLVGTGVRGEIPGAVIRADVIEAHVGGVAEGAPRERISLAGDKPRDLCIRVAAIVLKLRVARTRRGPIDGAIRRLNPSAADLNRQVRVVMMMTIIVMTAAMMAAIVMPAAMVVPTITAAIVPPVVAMSTIVVIVLPLRLNRRRAAIIALAVLTGLKRCRAEHDRKAGNRDAAGAKERRTMRVGASGT